MPHIDFMLLCWWNGEGGTQSQSTVQHRECLQCAHTSFFCSSSSKKATVLNNFIISFQRQRWIILWIPRHPETNISEADHQTPALTNEPTNQDTLQLFTKLQLLMVHSLFDFKRRASVQHYGRMAFTGANVAAERLVSTADDRTLITTQWRTALFF